MRKLLFILLAWAILIGWTGPVAATPTIVSFEDFPSGTFSSHTEDGATFSAVEGGPLRAVFDMLASAATPMEEIRADIDGGATFVSVDLGDGGGDADPLFLEVYDMADSLLGAASDLLPAGTSGFRTLSISEPQIAYAVFGARGASGGSSIFVRTFAFEPVVTIPAPGGLLLAALGVGLVSSLRRRIG